MMGTNVLTIGQVPQSTGLPKDLVNPIKPHLFVGTHERRLGKSVGMTQFGVNHVTLLDDHGEHTLEAGSFAGFPAGQANGHHLMNASSAPASFIVVGSRKPGQETIHYPDDRIGPISK